MGRRILNRRDLRADFEAAERRKTDDEEVDEEEEEAGDEDEEAEGDSEAGEGDEEGAAEDEDEGDVDSEGDEDDEAPKKKKKKKVVKEPKVKAKPKSRSRAAKVVRMKVVWGVFSNSNQRVATYDYPKKDEADAHAARLTTDKKSTHFVQPIKEPIEEKKEKEK